MVGFQFLFKLRKVRRMFATLEESKESCRNWSRSEECDRRIREIFGIEPESPGDAVAGQTPVKPESNPVKPKMLLVKPGHAR
jgi:hypothetical protein